MSLKEKLLSIQIELKAPKGQMNKFGNYKYRSCEDILEAVKPLLENNKCVVTLFDEVVNIGNRYYVKATASLSDTESEILIQSSAYAREEESKKGMDGSQITGASSSYARKYALNGLFAIDDTKDSDSTNIHEKSSLNAEAGKIFEPEPQNIKIIQPDASNEATEQNKSGLDEKIVEKIKKAQTKEELGIIWNELPEADRPKYLEMLSTRKAIIKANKVKK